MLDFSEEYTKVRPRRGSVSNWAGKNPVLLLGELAIEYPDGGDLSSGNIKFKVGDGVTDWNHLPYCTISESVATSIVAGGVKSTNVISIKKGTKDDWEEYNPVLQAGEIAYDSTLGEIKVGDGVHRFTDLRYIGQTWESNKIYDFGCYDNPDSL